MKLTHEEFLAKELPSTYYAIFKGSVDPKTGINWCSDCVTAEPAINKIAVPLAKENELPLYIVSCGLREVWKDKQHPLRISYVFKLTGVPTMVKVEDGEVLQRLVEGELADETMLTLMMEEDD